jgi:cysteine-rich repeat protein
MRKYLSFVGVVGIAVSILFFAPSVVAEDYGLGATAGAAGLTKYGNSVPTIAGNVIGTLLSMISVLFFVLVLYGGILWMTARGNSEQTGKALNTIIAATIGIIIVMGAYALTNFVFQLGGASSGAGGTTPTQPAVCGNGQIEPGEQCDGDPECTSSCTVIAVCGNGVMEGAEGCDDGNTTNGNGCSSTCEVESGWVCDGNPSVCTEGPDL